jgi:hypothetical protein
MGQIGSRPRFLRPSPRRILHSHRDLGTYLALDLAVWITAARGGVRRVGQGGKYG